MFHYRFRRKNIVRVVVVFICRFYQVNHVLVRNLFAFARNKKERQHPKQQHAYVVTFTFFTIITHHTHITTLIYFLGYNISIMTFMSRASVPLLHVVLMNMVLIFLESALYIFN